MVPQHYVFLADLPRTANGKLDRKALPAPTAATAAPHVAPRTPIEHALARLWSRLLRRDAIGIHDNFFALGGDSLVALQLIGAARGEALALAPRDLFDHPTIAALAAHLDRAQPVPIAPTATPNAATDPTSIFLASTCLS